MTNGQKRDECDVAMKCDAGEANEARAMKSDAGRASEARDESNAGEASEPAMTAMNGMNAMNAMITKNQKPKTKNYYTSL